MNNVIKLRDDRKNVFQGEWRDHRFCPDILFRTLSKAALNITSFTGLSQLISIEVLSAVSGKTKLQTVTVMEAGMTPILVMGDRNRNKVQVMPGGAYVTLPIELPARWDELMRKLGCFPLSSLL